MALEEGTPGGGKSRADYCEVLSHGVQKRIRDGSDIAAIGGREGRAVFEKNLFCAAPLEPPQRGEGLPHRRLCRARTRGQSNNHSVGIVRRMCFAGHAHFLNRAHALADQNMAQIGRPGDVVSKGKGHDI